MCVSDMWTFNARERKGKVTVERVRCSTLAHEQNLQANDDAAHEFVCVAPIKIVDHQLQFRISFLHCERELFLPDGLARSLLYKCRALFRSHALPHIHVQPLNSISTGLNLKIAATHLGIWRCAEGEKRPVRREPTRRGVYPGLNVRKRQRFRA